MTGQAIERDVQMRGLSAEQRELLMVQVARRYYELDKTMGDLAAELGLTRWQASRLLSDAREAGIVEIRIVPRTPRVLAVEDRLQRRFGLKEAVVVPVGEDDEVSAVFDGVARAAARYIAGLGRVPLVGVSWGRTMNAVAAHLPQGWNEGAEIVLVNGAMNFRIPATRTNNTAELFARSAPGAATLLPVPAILGRAATRRALEEDPTIAAILDLARTAPVVIFGMGAMTPDSVILQAGFVDADEQAGLVARGAVGDILGRYIDGEGRAVDADLDARTLGLGLDEIGRRAYSIGIAAGPGKAAVARAAAAAGHVNVLVTDERTALTLLDEETR